jgi:Ca2+-binding EF-hand superfamily protein
MNMNDVRKAFELFDLNHDGHLSYQVELDL